MNYLLCVKKEKLENGDLRIIAETIHILPFFRRRYEFLGVYYALSASIAPDMSPYDWHLMPGKICVSNLKNARTLSSALHTWSSETFTPEPVGLINRWKMKFI